MSVLGTRKHLSDHNIGKRIKHEHPSWLKKGQYVMFGSGHSVHIIKDYDSYRLYTYKRDKICRGFPVIITSIEFKNGKVFTCDNVEVFPHSGLTEWRKSLKHGSFLNYTFMNRQFNGIVTDRTNDTIDIQLIGSRKYITLSINSDSITETSFQEECPILPRKLPHRMMCSKYYTLNGFCHVVDYADGLFLRKDEGNYSWVTEEKLPNFIPELWGKLVFTDTFQKKKLGTFEIPKYKLNLHFDSTYPIEMWQNMLHNGDEEIILFGLNQGIKNLSITDSNCLTLVCLLTMKYNSTNWLPVSIFSPCIGHIKNGRYLEHPEKIFSVLKKLSESLGMNGNLVQQRRIDMLLHQDVFPETVQGMVYDYNMNTPRPFEISIESADGDTVRFGVYFNGDMFSNLEFYMKSSTTLYLNNTIIHNMFSKKDTLSEPLFDNPWCTLDYKKYWDISPVFYDICADDHEYLLPYQKTILKCMMNYEETNHISHSLEISEGVNAITGIHWSTDGSCDIEDSYGGYLGLEMGIGKTVCTIALLQKRPMKTLIVVPLTIIDQWKLELSKFYPDANVTEYYGKRKNNTGNTVLTTYGVVRHMAYTGEIGTFDRVVFDESHTVRSIDSLYCTTCSNIVAKYRWCLSATPFKDNDISTISAQLSMLKIYPFGNSTLNNYLHTISHQYDKMPMYRSMIQKLILDIFIVQTKNGLLQRPNLNFKLKESNHEVLLCVQQPHEKMLYSSLRETLRKKLTTLNNECNILRHYGKISHFTQMLQVSLTHPCCVPLYQYGSIVDESKKHIDQVILSIDGLDGYEKNIKDQLSTLNPEDTNCSICLESLTRPTLVYPCYHLFCKECLDNCRQYNKKCPICRGTITTMCEITTDSQEQEREGKIYFTDVIGKNRCMDKMIYEQYNKWKTSFLSSKISVLQKKIKTIPKEDSIIIFSQYNSTLKMVQRYLAARQYKSELLIGSKSRSQRRDAIENFLNRKSTIFLLSTQTAGVGISLTTACHLFFMEPLMDKSIEAQAIGRLARMGQENIVNVYTLAVDNTIDTSTLSYKESYDKMVCTSKNRLTPTQMKKMRATHVLKIFDIN
jgi:superfamily II DNA or RNA helicase